VTALMQGRRASVVSVDTVDARRRRLDPTDAARTPRALPSWMSHPATTTASTTTTTGTERPSKGPCPFFKWIPGTLVTVDAFAWGALDRCVAYFLRHGSPRMGGP
jgi:hypothetical protein